jgi:endonuclease G, mitochondrial
MDTYQLRADTARAELTAALEELRAGTERPYYSQAEDESDRDAYYAGVDLEAAPAALYAALHELLERTHAQRPPYKPIKQVYPWVDLRPDRTLHSIYSDKPFDPETVIREDHRAAEARAARLRELDAPHDGPMPEQLDREFDELEAMAPYNCEHVVPQSWFAKQEPMRGDVHHLFTCESGCNSYRGNTPYFDFPDFLEVVRTNCGKLEADRFEPGAGKGPVARAVMYFLLRYPGLVDDRAGEFESERLGILLRWHIEEPPGEYERHRNAAIFAVQGNRNPLVDHPEKAARADFARGLGAAAGGRFARGEGTTPPVAPPARR